MAFRAYCRITTVILTLAACAWAESQSLPSFLRGVSSNTITLVNTADVHEEAVDAATYLCIRPDTDPYTEVQWLFDIPAAALTPDTEYALEVGFLDRGAGVIEPALTAAGITRSESFTRLNTGTERTAVFAFRTGAAQPEAMRLSISGLQYLKSLRIAPAYSAAQWQAAQDSVPRDVRPMVTLERPVDLVTTAGISAQAVTPDVEAELQAVHNYAPLAKVLGFNGIEMYLRWRLIEPEQEGVFDFTYYDRLVAKLQEYGLKWFPLLIIGSAYALPDWFADSKENVGFVCLEHGLSNPIQSIWSPYHKRHVERVLKAFGDHYEPTNTLLGVRLGPSGNYGESQYPAGGNWPLKGRAMHIHIGLWSADEYGRADFQNAMRAKYGDIAALNAAWGQELDAFDAVPMTLPLQMVSKRQRIDFHGWYTQSMTNWCEYWALEARKAMPNTRIYQSSGGWGFVEAGTSYSGQAKSMRLVDGGIRLTNETDSYEQNVCATRLAATAARLYGVELGYEPASSHTARGVVGRIFNTIATNGDHLFTYQSNIFNHQMSIDRWLEYLPLFDTRRPPVVDVAVYYPETMNQLEDAAFRHLYAWGFNPRAMAVRRAVDVEYLDETLIRDGFLDRYKALVFCWGEFIEADVLAAIDAWVRKGGCVIYPSFPRGNLSTVEGDTAVFAAWAAGDTGAGRFMRFRGDMEPQDDFGDFVHASLRELDSLNPWTKAVLRIAHPEKVFFSVQDDGHALALNYADAEAVLQLPASGEIAVPAYGIARFALE